ncbi:hypothetical protein [Roseovarius indicus]|uniref:hypothetical protein n=1 Tax=Roseovarius indicus TaxID=540747 RepID=UPI0032EB468C
MVKIWDIEDQGTLKAWLEEQPREVAVWIASRVAARVLPVWWDAVLTEEWAHKLELNALPALRSLLISSVAGIGRLKESWPAVEASHATRAAAVAATASNALVAQSAAAAASHAARGAHVAPASAAVGAVHAASAAASAYTVALWAAIKTDAEQTSGGGIPYDMPLWPDGKGPLAKEWGLIKSQLSKSSDIAAWEFWIEWYDALLDGRPMLGDAGRTWEMLEKIVLIDPKTWDAGPEVVNPVIREIWDLYRLRDEVAALRAEKERLLAGRASAEARSHNQPPELVDTEPEMARQVEVIWAGLDAAQDELEQEVPDKHVLQRIAEEMLAALKAVAGYCAKVGDTVVMSAAKVGGGAVGTAILDHVANNGRLLQFAKDLLQHAISG